MTNPPRGFDTMCFYSLVLAVWGPSSGQAIYEGGASSVVGCLQGRAQKVLIWTHVL